MKLLLYRNRMWKIYNSVFTNQKMGIATIFATARRVKISLDEGKGGDRERFK